jgi:integrase
MLLMGVALRSFLWGKDAAFSDHSRQFCFAPHFPILLFFFGVRPGEALQIAWPQVDLDARLIRLETSKLRPAMRV